MTRATFTNRALFALLAPSSLAPQSAARPNRAKFASQLGIWNGFQTVLRMMRRQKYKRNGSRQQQMFLRSQISIFYCFKRCAITMRAARLGDPIQPGAYTIAICSAFKGARQQEAIVSKIPAQAYRFYGLQ